MSEIDLYSIQSLYPYRDSRRIQFEEENLYVEKIIEEEKRLEKEITQEEALRVSEEIREENIRTEKKIEEEKMPAPDEIREDEIREDEIREDEIRRIRAASMAEIERWLDYQELIRAENLQRVNEQRFLEEIPENNLQDLSEYTRREEILSGTTINLLA